MRDYDEANHRPEPVLNGDRSRDVRVIASSSMSRVSMSALGTTDPDGDELSYHWFVYPEAGTFRGNVEILNGRDEDAVLVIPSEARGKSIHVILEVEDGGEPNLVGYRRLVVVVD